MRGWLLKPIPQFTVKTYAYAISAMIIAFIAYSGYREYYFEIKRIEKEEELVLVRETLANKLKELSLEKTRSADFMALFQAARAENSSFGEQIRQISSTVGLLDKLSKTDEELLQKYSNVYFLNENYVPPHLSDIDPAYLYRKDKPEQIHSGIKKYLESLLRSANEASVPVQVLSGYRSFNSQASLKTNYKVVYGEGTANQFSADQGYSEHQLGSTVDLTTSKTGELLDGFEKTSAYTWLVDNAYKYGFILSYPNGNRFYEFEPWHWRFVGVELATKLHNDSKNFYDLDQREIEQYLVKIFD